MLELVPLRGRPDLRPQLFADRLQGLWPEFMQHDPTADLYFAPSCFDGYLDHAFAIVDPAEPDIVVGRAFAVPFAFGLAPERSLPEQRGRGASRTILDAMRRHARDCGYAHMFAPVRPTAKHLEPLTPIGAYVARRTPDGLPADPWLRVHARSGGEIVKIAPLSMILPGSIADWSRWTSMTFRSSGQVVVPGALVPVHVSLEQDQAVYVEPNVWVRHALPD